MSSLPYAPNYSIILFSRQRLFPTFLYLFFLSFVFPFLFGLQLLLVSLLDNLSPFVFLFFSHEKNIYFTFSSHYCFNFLILRDTGDIFIYSIEVWSFLLRNIFVLISLILLRVILRNCLFLIQSLFLISGVFFHLSLILSSFEVIVLSLSLFWNIMKKISSFTNFMSCKICLFARNAHESSVYQLQCLHTITLYACLYNIILRNEKIHP